MFVVNRVKEQDSDDQLFCDEQLDSHILDSSSFLKLDPSPVRETRVVNTEVSEGVEEFLAWRRNYANVDEGSEEEHDEPTIKFTDDVSKLADDEPSPCDMETGVDDC